MKKAEKIFDELSQAELPLRVTKLQSEILWQGVRLSRLESILNVKELDADPESETKKEIKQDLKDLLQLSNTAYMYEAIEVLCKKWGAK